MPGTSLMNGWYGEYGLTSCNADSQKIAVNAGANSPFTYAELHEQEMLIFLHSVIFVLIFQERLEIIKI